VKKILLATFGLALLSGTAASAADMAVKARPVVAPVYVWNGWYAGVNIGYGGGNETDGQNTISGAGFPAGVGAGRPLYGGPTTFKLAPQGVFGGAQAGYNWQTSQHAVFGLEADFQGSAFKDSDPCVLGCGVPLRTTTPPNFLNNFPVIFANDLYTHKIDWFGTVRGRVGYADGPTLIYLTGGLAYGDVERSGNVVGRTTFGGAGTVNTFAGSYNSTSTKIGWTLGGGAEGKLASNPAWSIKGEYLYVDLGSNSDVFNTIFTTGGGGAVAGRVAATRTDTSNNREHLFRLGLNYAFNAGVPKF
jgi:outer membrane immunogenic protein